MIMKALVFLEKSFDVVKHSIEDATPLGVGITSMFSLIIGFVVRSWQVNFFLFVVLLFLIATNTWSGVRLARKNKTYDIKILKETLISKMIGYLILIIGVSLLVILFFIATLKDGISLFPEYFLNVMVIATFVGLGIFEFKSILENLKANNNEVPKFLDNVVEKAEGKLNDLTDF